MITSYDPGLANMPCARCFGRLSLTMNFPMTHFSVSKIDDHLNSLDSRPGSSNVCHEDSGGAR